MLKRKNYKKGFQQEILINTKANKKQPSRKKLPDQGSNLDSSAPKTDVLPVTPSGMIIKWCAKIIIM